MVISEGLCGGVTVRHWHGHSRDRSARDPELDALQPGPHMVSVTCAIPRGLRSRVPAKMTSSMREPRRLLALCSPSTQLMASLRLDFPQPLGPTTAVTPEPWKRISVRS